MLTCFPDVRRVFQRALIDHHCAGLRGNLCGNQGRGDTREEFPEPDVRRVFAALPPVALSIWIHGGVTKFQVSSALRESVDEVQRRQRTCRKTHHCLQRSTILPTSNLLVTDQSLPLCSLQSLPSFGCLLPPFEPSVFHALAAVSSGASGSVILCEPKFRLPVTLVV